MGIHLITGQGKADHVTSADAASLHAGIVGTGRYVLNRGSKFAYEILSNNLIKVKDGDLLNQGRHMNIAANDYEECVIENGLQSVKRNDLIVIRYIRNTETEIETASLVVLKGISGDNAKDPEYTKGNILEGDAQDDFPLYRVRLNGLTIEGVDQLFTVNQSVSDLRDYTDTLTRANDQRIWRKIGKNQLHCVTDQLATAISGSGLTFVVNMDKSLTFTGTATKDCTANIASVKLHAGNYLLTGCPVDTAGYMNNIAVNSLTGDPIAYYYATQSQLPAAFTLTSDTNVNVSVSIKKDSNMSGKTFYPQICFADAENPEKYEPYAPSNAELFSSSNYYAVCSTDALTSEKVASSVNGSNILQLTDGTHVKVYFTYGNGVNYPTLNLNGSGAKPIELFGTTPVMNAWRNWNAGDVVELVYMNGSWIICGIPTSKLVDIGNYCLGGIHLNAGNILGSDYYGNPMRVMKTLESQIPIGVNLNFQLTAAATYSVVGRLEGAYGSFIVQGYMDGALYHIYKSNNVWYYQTFNCTSGTLI